MDAQITITAEVVKVENGYRAEVLAQFSNGQKPSKWQGRIYKSEKLAQKDAVRELEYAMKGY